jgi:hypothetical protein
MLSGRAMKASNDRADDLRSETLRHDHACACSFLAACTKSAVLFFREQGEMTNPERAREGYDLLNSNYAYALVPLAL